MVRGFVASACGIAALALVAPARAQSTDAERIKAAAEEFDAGRRAFKAKDFEVAAGHFENADRDAPAPEALRSAIRARESAGQLAVAATLAASALVRYPDDKGTAKLARQILSTAEKSLHRVIIRCSPACTLLVDKKLTAFGETAAALLYLDPGRHEVVAGWSGDRSVPKPVEAAAGNQSELTFAAPPLPSKPAPASPVVSTNEGPSPPPPPPPAEKRGGLPRYVFFTAAGATVILGGVTIWSGLDTTSSPGHDKVRQDCAGKDESCPTYQQALSKQHRTNILLGATGVVGVAAAVIGIGFTDWSSKSAPTAGKSLGPLREVEPLVAAGSGFSLGARGLF